MTARARMFALASVASLACAGCNRAVAYMDFERMEDQKKLEVYEPSSVFADGRGMRRPPVGTVPRERLVDRPEITLGVGPEGEVREVPLAVDRALLERGRDRFERFCGACHGVLGYGNPAIVENAELRPPPSLHEPRIQSQPPGRIFRTITWGFGLMPSYHAQLSVLDRWAVVAYLPVLWMSQKSELAQLPTSVQADAVVALDAQKVVVVP